MAAIAKIRQRTGLLFVVIFVAMAAFILGDLFSGGARQQDFEIGSIKGKKVSYVEYETKVQQELDALRSVGQTIDEQTTQAIRNQVWDQLVKRKVLLDRLPGMGIRVTKDEYDDIRFGVNASSAFVNDPTFISPETGQFDPNMVRRFFVMLQENYPLYEEVQRMRLLENRLDEKYKTLVKKSVFVNALDASFEHTSKEAKARVDFAFKRYTAVPDSLVKVTTEDLKTFYNKEKSKAKYKQEESRSIDYVVFRVDPSADDRALLLEQMELLKADFSETENDSLFILANADTPIYSPIEYKAGDNPGRVDEILTSGQIGEVVGPYEENGFFKLAFVKDITSAKEVKARHILISGSTMSAKEARTKLEGLRAEAKRKGNFAELAKTNSEDPGSGANGGDLGWFGRGMMVPPFEEASFNGKVGDMPIVETDFGVHLIEILENRNTPVLKLAVLDKKISPSVTTFNEVYDVASEFSINNKKRDKFLKEAEDLGLVVQQANNIPVGNPTIGNFRNARNLSQWVFKSKLNEVSEPFEIDNSQFVVAALSSVKAEGTPAFEDIKDVLEVELLNIKKAEYIKSSIQGAEDLKTVAEKMGVSTQNANSLAFSTFSVPGAGGSEPKVIGKVFSTAPANFGNLLSPVAGEAGVYVLVVKDITPAPERTDFTEIQSTLGRRQQNRATNAAYRALVDNADVKDSRGRFL
ncbi:MAG: peptidylprolyl isomerase [Luteibaculaceae bacterium]